MIHVLETILDNLPDEIIQEFRFHNKRRYRLDFCVIYQDKPLLGIEYNGLNFRNANHNGHSSNSGMIKDMEKLNLALESGIPILQYNCKSLQNPEAVETQIKTVINNLKQNKFK